MDVEWFAKKKVTVMGLGLHGGGRAIAQWLFQAGASVTVTDLKVESELASSLDLLRAFCTDCRIQKPFIEYSAIIFHLGGHREEDFVSADLVIQNPGVPRESSFLSRARENGVSIENEASLFFALTKKTPKIAVTGTRGKSTTTALIGDMLSRWNERTLTVGIATHEGARALFDSIDTVLENEKSGNHAPVVIELSSWQLELFEATTLKATIAVVTNVLTDHLNRYVDNDAYAYAKSMIFTQQDEHDSVVLNYDNSVTLSWGLKGTRSVRYWFTRQKGAIDRGASLCAVNDIPTIRFKDRDGNIDYICRRDEISLHGDHNLENVLAAVSVAKIWGVPTEHIRASLRAFRGLPDRCETISLTGGRTWVNDTTATTPDATCAALKTLASGSQNIILIAGGADKGLDYSFLAPLIKEKVQFLVLLSGSATPRLVEAVKAVQASVPMAVANSMQHAVELAWKESAKGDMILLSPAAASFGMFVHEFDQGQQFTEAIKKLPAKG